MGYAPMHCVSLLRRSAAIALALAASLLGAGCGGAASSTTTTICRDPSVCTVQEAAESMPSGSNTTEIVVDSGPKGGFALMVTNVPYVTVTVCSPGSSTECATIDHVLLDTGSYGLRLLKSKVSPVALPGIPIAAEPTSGTPAGDAAECYAFVLGAVWGPLARADVLIGGEKADSVNIQLIDDGAVLSPPVPPNCTQQSQSGLMNSVSDLQANGILGVGVVGVDCGVTCLTNTYAGGYIVYYSCPPGGAACEAAGLPVESQVQNPVTRFAVNNNGTMVVMPKLPDLGAMEARGRLVFGIGTQANNQLPAGATMYQINTNPASPEYLYVALQVASRNYTQSFIDTGANAMFFDEPTLSQACTVSSGHAGSWYCPTSTWRQTATLTDSAGATGTFSLAVTSADVLFNSGAAAFATLAGSAGQATETFALGMPFFYGRTVSTSIWGQTLSSNGPWYAF
ncbi:MAG TPA: DUF3443 family protein [Burkholderiaceae bacterium]|nr:DUF3443 family protein [Burkholderiaceae bacterium]